jgi:hypothetical protein
MNKASVDKCLDLLLELQEAVRRYGRWPELEKEIDEIISSLELEIRRSESPSVEGDQRLKEILSEAIWWISLLFNLFID